MILPELRTNAFWVRARYPLSHYEWNARTGQHLHDGEARYLPNGCTPLTLVENQQTGMVKVYDDEEFQHDAYAAKPLYVIFPKKGMGKPKNPFADYRRYGK